VPEPTPSLQDQLDAHLAKSRAARAPEVNAALAATADRLRAEGMLDTARGVGASAPAFTLPNAIGNDVSLRSMLERGPVVLVWYRGGW
jgi:hypothetical protein